MLLGNMLPGNMLLVASNMLLVRATCCRATLWCKRGLRHILASPWYADGTIAVSVTWMERGFNTGQMHYSMYPSIFNRLRAIARYWSEIAPFSYSLHSTPPLGVPIGIPGKSLVFIKLESWGSSLEQSTCRSAIHTDIFCF